MKDQLTNQLANIFREYLQKELSIKVKFQNLSEISKVQVQ